MTDFRFQRKYFISHAAADKPFAVELKQSLDADAWVDLYEIAVGDILLEKISTGIEAATDFVLLWSEHSTSSKWVRFEAHMAFIRHLEDNAIAIRILCLDETPVPLQFRPFLQGRRVESAEQATRLLQGAPAHSPIFRAFIDRNEEIGALESALYSSETGLFWLWGITGVGKRAIVREALNRIVQSTSNARTIEVRAGTRFAELDLLVSASQGRPLPDDNLTEEQAENRVSESIAEFASAGGIWAFTEAQHWLEEDGRPSAVLSAVLTALERGGTNGAEKLAIFTTTRRPALEGIDARLSAQHRIGGLRTDFGMALLRARGSRAEDDLLRQASQQLDGHPLALEIIAPELDEIAPDWEDFRARAANGVVSELALDTLTTALLERLAAVDGPLLAEQYAEHLKVDESKLQNAISEGVAYSLIEQGASGFLRLHPLIRDFYMRAFRRREEFIEETGDLASRAEIQLELATVGSATYVDALLSTFRLLCWAGRLKDAIELRKNLYGTLFETAVELYNQRRYADARRYFEEVIESTDDNRTALLYLARTLAYLGEVRRAREIVDEVLERSPNDYHAWRIRGRIEFIAREFRNAIGFYERANEIRPGVPAVLRDLGQARMRVQDWFGARAALEAAMQKQPRDPDPYLAFQYSQVLEHFGEFEEALAVASRAIRRDPQNVGFHHRIGRIAEKLGDRETARREYARCLELEPEYAESLVSLASMDADDGDLESARKRLETAAQVPGVRAAVARNVEAKIYLKGQDFAAARSAIENALAEDRDVPSLDLAARIELEAISAGAVRCSDVSDKVRGFAEEIRVKGRAGEADSLLTDLANACN
jgi:tetratricopeptide (TPR) repeat protein